MNDYPTPPVLVEHALRVSRARTTVEPIVKQAHSARQLAQGHTAEGGHALAMREIAEAHALADSAFRVLYGAVLGSSLNIPSELLRPVEHECARVIQEAVERGGLGA